MHHQVKIVNSSLPGAIKNNTCIFLKKKETCNQGQLLSSTN